MIKIFILILMIGGPVAGIILIISGAKENRVERIPFRLKDLFLRTPEYERSGTIRIVEGIATLFGSLILIYYFISVRL